jgi:PKD repeat protein
VLAADGLSKGAGGIVVTGRNGVNHGFSFTPASPAAGQVVTFSALAEVSRQPVVSYLWSFGDGAMGTGAKPTHAYARSGTYTIRLVLFSGVGSAFPGQGAAPIVSAKITVT